MVSDEMIREWFKDHVADLKDLGDIQILKWKRPDSINYSVRYVFDGQMMYISGDLGSAVYWLTWKADVHSFNVGIGYFNEKLAAFSDDRWDFSSEKAVKRLREWLNDIKESGKEYDHDDMKDFFEDARSCSQHWEWVEAIHSHDKLISSLDGDYWEWMYGAGNECPTRLRCYLIGLQMASAQLKAKAVA